MDSVQDIAKRRGVFMFEINGIVLVCANDTHWFSTTNNVRSADDEAGENNDDFCDACTAISKRDLGGKYARDVSKLLTQLQEQHPNVYARLGGSHANIIDGVV